MITLMQEKIKGMFVETIEKILPDCVILNSDNIKNGDYVFLSEDGKNLDSGCSLGLKQIIGTYIGNNVVKLYCDLIKIEDILDTKVIKLNAV